MSASKVLDESLVSRVFHEATCLRGTELLQEGKSHLADGHVPPQGVDENVTLLLNDLAIELLPLVERKARRRKPVMRVGRLHRMTCRWTKNIPTKKITPAMMYPIRTSFCEMIPAGGE